MNFKRSLILFMLFILLPVVIYAAVPEICRVQGGHTRTIWGAGFTPGATEIFSINIPFDEKAAIAILESSDYKRGEQLPPIPPKEAGKLNIVGADPRGLVLAAEFSNDYSPEGFYNDRMGDDVIWVKNQDGFSKPWLVKASDAWFVYPEKTSPGTVVRIFGRNIDAKLVAIKKIGDQKVQMLKSSTVQSRATNLIHNVMYETEIRLTQEIATGEYELFVHNGSGGVAGWSDPLKLTIKPKENKPYYYDSKDYGVKSNGYTDDTEALRKALSAAAKTGGVVMLQSGSTIISETIELPAGVSIRGGGEGASSIQVINENPMRGAFPETAVLENYAHDWLKNIKEYAPMLWLRNNSSISDLSLVYGAGVGFGILVARCNGVAENIRIERIKVVANTQPDNWHSAYPVLIGGDTYSLVIADCDFRGWGAIEVIANNHKQAYVGRNKMVTIPVGLQNTFFTRGFNESVIESNEVYYGLRNYYLQNGRKYGIYNKPDSKIKNLDLCLSTTHQAVIGNIFINNPARRHNDGELAIESGSALWWGTITAGDQNSVTITGEPFDVDLSDNYVMILDGRGVGQYRRIISNTNNKLILEKNWDVIPDKTTFISVGGFDIEHLWIDNTLDNNASWCGFWGNNAGHVVDGQIMRDGGSFNLWAWDDKAPSVVAFIDLIGIRTIGGGGINFIGEPVFGNTVRYSEIIDFRYYPNFHIVPGWLQNANLNKTFGIRFFDYFSKKSFHIPESAPLLDWNIFEANHIADGPYGIRIPDKANYTIIKKNAIHVDNDPFVDESKTTIYK